MIKKLFFLLVAMLVSATASAKDLRTIVFKVEQMVCVNCEGHVKRNIAYEKGVKKMKTNIEQKTVQITFDADVTSIEKLQKGFEKNGYAAEPLSKTIPEKVKVAKTQK